MYITYALLGVSLATALIYDLRARRIPNGLIGLMLVEGLTLQYATGGSSAALAGLGGLAVGFAVFFPLYMRGGMGAGDVKLMAASGVFLSPSLTVQALLYTLVFGGVLALTRLFIPVSPTVAEEARAMPYAPAICAGVAATLARPL